MLIPLISLRSCAVLHPRHKLAYFKSACWEDTWIDAAERIVRAEFNRSYACQQDTGEDEGEGSGNEEKVCNELFNLINNN